MKIYKIITVFLIISFVLFFIFYRAQKKKNSALFSHFNNLDERLGYVENRVNNIEKEISKLNNSLNNSKNNVNSINKYSYDKKKYNASFSKEIKDSYSESDESSNFLKVNKGTYTYYLDGYRYEINAYDTYDTKKRFHYYGLYVCSDSFCDEIKCDVSNCIELGFSDAVFSFPDDTVIHSFGVKKVYIPDPDLLVLEVYARTNRGVYKELLAGSDVRSLIFLLQYSGAYDGVFPFNYEFTKVTNDLYLLSINVLTSKNSTDTDKMYLIKINRDEQNSYSFVDVEDYELNDFE